MVASSENFDPYAQWLGLNLREQPLDHYLLLGLERYESDPATIERQADERMRLVRSFQTGPRGKYTQKLMNDLAAAKLCLLSPAAKRSYDEQLRLWSQSPAETVSPGSPLGIPPHDVGLPPGALPAVAPPMVLPPPVGVHEFVAPPLPPAAPPVATAEPDGEGNGEDMGEEPAERTSSVLLIAGAVLGLLSLTLAGWLVSAMWRPKTSGTEESHAAVSAIDGYARSPATSSTTEKTEDAIPLPGTGRLELPDEGAPIEVLQEGSGDVALSPATAVLNGQLELSLEGTEEVIIGWSSPEDVAAWKFRLIEPGFFQAQVTYSAGGESFGRKLEVTVDGQAKTFELQPRSEGYRTDLLTIAIPKSGPHTLSVRQTSVFDGELRVKLVRLQAIAK